MTHKTIKNINHFSDHIKDLDFYLDSKWASTYTDYRLNIRRHLYKKTKNKKTLDLEYNPSLTDTFVSISHCPILGGFVLSPKNVGLDLEQLKRLSPGLIYRISTENELAKLAENFKPAMWTIKESVYKCEQSFDSNIAAVKLISAEIINDFFIKTISVFKNKSFQTLTLISVDQDVCISVSFAN